MTSANPSESGDSHDEYQHEPDRHHDDHGSPASNSSAEPTRDKSGDTLAVTALILPLVAEGLLLAGRFDSSAIAWGVSLGAVAVTALLLAVDAARLGSVDRNGIYRGGAGGLFVGMLLIWIFCYPVAYFRRRHFGRPNYGPLAILVVAFFAVVPFVQNRGDFDVFGSEPPKCTSREVIATLDDIIRQNPGTPPRRVHPEPPRNQLRPGG